MNGQALNVRYRFERHPTVTDAWPRFNTTRCSYYMFLGGCLEVSQNPDIRSGHWALSTTLRVTWYPGWITDYPSLQWLAGESPCAWSRLADFE